MQTWDFKYCGKEVKVLEIWPHLLVLESISYLVYDSRVCPYCHKLSYKGILQDLANISSTCVVCRCIRNKWRGSSKRMKKVIGGTHND